MKKKKIYPFAVIATLVLCFIVAYDISEVNSGKFAFAETIDNMRSAYQVPQKSIVEIKYDVESESVDYETKIVYNENEYEGYEKVTQEGVNGTKKLIYEKIYKNGKLLLMSKSDESIFQDPIHKIIEKGTKTYLNTSRGGVRYKNEIVMEATAYDLSFQSTGKYPGDPYYGITASGTQAKIGTVAVDPRVIPLGTKLYVASLDGSPDYGFATAEDTGGAIKGNKIDLFMNSTKDAYTFGRRNVKVYILE